MTTKWASPKWASSLVVALTLLGLAACGGDGGGGSSSGGGGGGGGTLPAGSLDPSFGTGGKVTTDFGSGFDVAFALALTSDGKIVVAGTSFNGANYDVALARYYY